MFGEVPENLSGDGEFFQDRFRQPLAAVTGGATGSTINFNAGGSSDADGISVPAGFTRIAAFRGGVAGNMDACYSRYPA